MKTSKIIYLVIISVLYVRVGLVLAADDGVTKSDSVLAQQYAAPKEDKKDNKQYKADNKESGQKKTTTIREEAFRSLVNRTFPMKPDQIVELHRQLDATEQAAATPPQAPPLAMSSTITIDLAPGSTPPVIRLAAGYVTSLVFVDATGQPWPVADYSLGNPQSFNIQWDSKTNALFVQSMSMYVTANLAIRLANLETPIMLSLVTGQKEVDYRVDLQVKGRGPYAAPAIIDDNLPSGPRSELLSVLDGVPPTGSIAMKVSGGHGQAWRHNGKIILRTKLTLLSPAWYATVSSPDGTKVYELAETPMILASLNGKTLHLELTGL